jgi:hypothetical protein
MRGNGRKRRKVARRDGGITIGQRAKLRKKRTQQPASFIGPYLYFFVRESRDINFDIAMV